MAVFCHDPDAWRRGYSLGTLDKMQQRDPNGDRGATKRSNTPGSQSVFRSLGHAWLTLAVAEKIDDSPHDLVGIRRFDEGGIIIQRTPHVVNSFSWGAKTMAMCVPLRLDRIVSPVQRAGVGRIVLQGSSQCGRLHHEIRGRTMPSPFRPTWWSRTETKSSGRVACFVRCQRGHDMA